MLPTVTDRVIIDSPTQPNGGRVTLTPVRPNEDVFVPPPLTGLTISTGSSTVRGLDIEYFGKNGIELNGGGGNLIEGNFIYSKSSHTDRTDYAGIRVTSANNRIGGCAAGNDNHITGNRWFGVLPTKHDDEKCLDGRSTGESTPFILPNMAAKFRPFFGPMAPRIVLLLPTAFYRRSWNLCSWRWAGCFLLTFPSHADSMK
jgi:hypothetical protein